MANLIQAFAAYCPRIILRRAAAPQSFMKFLTKRTTLSSGVVKNVQESEVEALIDLLGEGRPVHTGVAIFTPSLDRHGNVKVNVRVDKRIIAALNAPGRFNGMIRNGKNVGIDTAAFIRLWDEEHPEDPIGPQAEGEASAK